MKIQVLSDLHLEHDPYFAFEKAEDADVLVLAGDIHSFDLGYDFVKSCAEQIPTIMILGNHEPMGYTIEECTQYWKSVKLDNFYFLDNETVEINGVHFIGSTLWTDLYANPVGQLAILHAVADFKKILKEDRSGTVGIDDLQAEFEKCKAFIQGELAKNYDKKVLITHHLPTYGSVSEKYMNSSLNASFVSNLDTLLMYSENLSLCIHGHTHDILDYMLTDDLRVVCNPRGYPGENKEFNSSKVVEI